MVSNRRLKRGQKREKRGKRRERERGGGGKEGEGGKRREWGRERRREERGETEGERQRERRFVTMIGEVLHVHNTVHNAAVRQRVLLRCTQLLLSFFSSSIPRYQAREREKGGQHKTPGSAASQPTIDIVYTLALSQFRPSIVSLDFTLSYDNYYDTIVAIVPILLHFI